MYWDYNQQFLLDPRVNISFHPALEKEVVFRFQADIILSRLHSANLLT